MRHLFLAQSDYAASGAAFAWALKTVGEGVRYYSATRHQYQYPHQFDSVIPWRQGDGEELMQREISWAQVVWIIQSELPICMGGCYGAAILTNFDNPVRELWMRRMRGKKIVLLHGGGHYRDYRDIYQKAWESESPLSLCYEADLIGSFEDEHLVIPPVSREWVPQVEKTWQGLRVGHFPSRPTDKGSEWIVPLCQAKRLQFVTSVTDPRNQNGVARVSWSQQVERMAQCDAIVDQVKPELNGKPFGEWVSIATEAAAMGRISIANSLNPQPYVDTYGRMPGIHICNNADELSQELDRLMGLTENELEREKAESGEWAHEYHGLESTGKLLKTYF